MSRYQHGGRDMAKCEVCGDEVPIIEAHLHMETTWVLDEKGREEGIQHCLTCDPGPELDSRRPHTPDDWTSPNTVDTPLKREMG